MEPIPHVLREARTRHSSYAFSHREGYADLITQGTVLRRSPGVNSDTLVDHTRPPDELPSSMEESSWYPRKMLFLGRKRRQHQGKVSSEDVQPASEVSSSLPVDGQSSPYQESQHSLTKNRLSGSLQEKLPKRQERSLSCEPWPYTPQSLPPTKETPLSAEESQMTSSESQMLPSSQLSLKSQSAHLQEKTFLWKIRKLSWKNWPYTWQKESRPPQGGDGTSFQLEPHCSDGNSTTNCERIIHQRAADGGGAPTCGEAAVAHGVAARAQRGSNSTRSGRAAALT